MPSRHAPRAESPAGDAPATGGERAVDSSSVVRKRSRGVTVLPSAEGRSLRSDPRWTVDGARRAERLLGNLVALRRRLPARG